MSDGAIKGGITMTKDEILLRSRLEGKDKFDEREYLASLRAGAIASGIGRLLCLLIWFICSIMDASIMVKGTIMVIFLGMHSADYIARAILIRTPWMCVFAVAFTLLFLFWGIGMLLLIL